MRCPYCHEPFFIVPLIADPDLSDPVCGYLGRNLLHGKTARLDLLGQKIRSYWIGLHLDCGKLVEVVNDQVSTVVVAHQGYHLGGE